MIRFNDCSFYLDHFFYIMKVAFVIFWMASRLLTLKGIDRLGGWEGCMGASIWGFGFISFATIFFSFWFYESKFHFGC